MRSEKFLLQPQPASSLAVAAAAQLGCPARNTRQEAPVLHSGAAYVHLRPFVLDPEWQPSKISGNHLCSRTSCDGLLLFAPDALPRVGRMLFHPAGRHFTHRVPCTRHLPGRHCAPDLHKDTVMIPHNVRASAAAARICAPAGAWWCVRQWAGDNGAARQGNSDRAHAPERVTVSPLCPLRGRLVCADCVCSD